MGLSGFVVAPLSVFWTRGGWDTHQWWTAYMLRVLTGLAWPLLGLLLVSFSTLRGRGFPGARPLLVFGGIVLALPLTLHHGHLVEVLRREPASRKATVIAVHGLTDRWQMQKPGADPHGRVEVVQESVSLTLRFSDTGETFTDTYGAPMLHLGSFLLRQCEYRLFYLPWTRELVGYDAAYMSCVFAVHSPEAPRPGGPCSLVAVESDAPHRIADGAPVHVSFNNNATGRRTLTMDRRRLFWPGAGARPRVRDLVAAHDPS